MIQIVNKLLTILTYITISKLLEKLAVIIIETLIKQIEEFKYTLIVSELVRLLLKYMAILEKNKL